ncbi:MAG: TetR/AcrR family transcriptional regulator [Bosea sp. (in: a-proteobacteria)]
MSRTLTSLSDPASRKGYHHGDLKQALTNVAEELLAEKGPAGFTLADAARRAGVSSAAPYRHFPDRETLIAEVARRGFQDFGARLAASSGASGPDTRGFISMGSAYLAFARERPGAYAAMFAGPLKSETQALQDAGNSAFQLLVQGISKALGGQAPKGADIPQLALQIWAVSHGVATLEASGQIKGILGSSPEAVLEGAVSALIEKARQGASLA